MWKQNYQLQKETNRLLWHLTNNSRAYKAGKKEGKLQGEANPDWWLRAPAADQEQK